MENVLKDGVVDAGQPSKGALPYLWQCLMRYRNHLVLLAISLLLATAVVLSMGQAVAFLVNKAFVQDNLYYLDLSLLILFGLVVFLSLASFGRVYYSNLLSERVSLDIKQETMADLLRQGSTFHDTHASGQLVSQLSHDLTLVQTLLSSSAPIAVRNMLMASGGIVMMVYTNVWLTSLVFLCAPVVISVLVLFAKRLRVKAADAQSAQALVHNQAADILSNIKLVQAYNCESMALSTYTNQLSRVFKLTKSYVRNRSVLVVMVMVSVFGAACFLLWMGATQVLEDKLSVGTLTSFVFYALLTAGSAGALSELYTEFQRAMAAIDRLQALQSTHPTENIRQKDSMQVPLPVKQLTFHDVHFSYPARPGVEVLDGFTLSLDLPKKIAIVGPSGTGKSTLFQLLLGFYPMNRGKIAVNGVDLAMVAPNYVRDLMAWVPQETNLPDATLESLLKYGNPKATTSMLWDVLKKAQLETFVQKLPDKLQTRVGEKGQTLSPGQRQRLSLARALLKDAQILLLDEATSALDAQNQKLIQKTLDHFKDKTLLIIAHRLSTVRYADEIIVMNEGKVIDVGDHEALLKRCVTYQTLCAGELLEG